MKTYTENAADQSNATETAILRSISHTEIVAVKCSDPAALADWIEANYDDAGHSRENDGSLDVWGARSGEDFRLRLIHA